MQQLIIYQISAHSAATFRHIVQTHTRPTLIRLGFQVEGFWMAETRVGPADKADDSDSPARDHGEVVYLLTWPDRAAMEAGWEALNADPAHRAFIDASREGGRHVVNIQNRLLLPIGPAPE